MMRNEITGPSQDNSHARMQLNAWIFTGIYCGLNLVLTLLLKFGCGMSWFDSLCHAFATMATGGFSTYNASVANFDSVFLDYLLVVFMILAGTNFTLLYWVVRGQPRRLWEDTELRTFLTLIFLTNNFPVYSNASILYFRIDSHSSHSKEIYIQTSHQHIIS